MFNFDAAPVQWTASDATKSLSDGSYIMAIRPYNVVPVKTRAATVAVTGTITVTELSGSESSAHFTFAGQNWVSLAHGIHPYEIGADRTFYMNPAHCFFFSRDGQLVA